MNTLKILLLLLLVTGCSQIDIKHYQGSTPSFDFFTYFQGETKGWGIVQDRKGVVTRQFVVDIVGTRDDDTLILKENFTWNDGEESQRTWILQKKGDHDFTGSADDVAGTAIGSSYGNALNWRYNLYINVDGTKWKIHLDDWMFLQPDGILINTTEMSKFGLHLGEITIVFRKTLP